MVSKLRTVSVTAIQDQRNFNGSLRMWEAVHGIHTVLRPRRSRVRTMSVSQRIAQLESHTLYNGSVRLDFDPVKHRYKINGEFAYGVTTALGIIAKPQLIWWAASQAADYVKSHLVPGQGLDELQIQDLCSEARKAHNKAKDKAADAGTYVHNWIEDFVNGKNPTMPVSPVIKRVIDDFLEWWEKTDVEVISPEQVFCSPTLMLAGTADLVCKVDGKLTIMDWKTGSGIYPEMFMQMAAYALMWEEEHPDQPIERLHVVNASVKNMFQDQFREDVQVFKDAYLKALALYKSVKEIEASFKK